MTPTNKREEIMETEITERPWSVDAMGYIRGPNSENILENHANAEYACRAVNAHEELLAMVRRLAHFSGCYDNGTTKGEPMDFIDYRLNVESLKDEAYKAIAKAEGR